MGAQQSFENHAQIVPAFHYFTFGLVAVNLLYWLHKTVRAFSVNAAMSLIAAIVPLMITLWARIFALRVQDRVIHLERCEDFVIASPIFRASRLLANGSAGTPHKHWETPQ